MGFWDKIKSAAKSAVNKAVSAVKKVASTIKKTVTKVVKKVSSTVKKVSSSVKKTVSSAVKKVSSAVKKAAEAAKKKAAEAAKKAAEAVKNVATTIKNTVSKVVEKVADKVEEVKDTIKEKASKTIAQVSSAVKKVADTIKKTVSGKTKVAVEKVEDLKWWEKVLVITRTKRILPFAPNKGRFSQIYKAITGKTFDKNEFIKLGDKIIGFISPINVWSKLIYGVNLEGEPEKFGTKQDFIDLSFMLVAIVPVGKVGTVAAKLGGKGFIKLFAAKAAPAIRLFSKLNVDDQAKMIRSLLKTDDGVKIINNLMAKKALDKTLVKPTILLVNKKIGEKILYGRGLGSLVRKGFKPKTIAFGLAGITGIIGMAYGIPFGTSWMAKEGLDEILRFPLRDRIKDYKFDPTPEKLESIKRSIAQLERSVPAAEKLVKSVAWLWPPTKDEWEMYLENLNFELDEMKEEIKELVVPEEMPEKIKVTVRDIIDGDTIDVSLDFEEVDKKPVIISPVIRLGETTPETTPVRKPKLPEYTKTGHARIRIVGINAPEKSPKGEILCSDVEIFEVEKEFADKSRDRLLPLNDKEVILKIDPEIRVDTYGRILAVVEYGGVDIGLRQIKEGLACGYYREPHKYFDEDEYSDATLDAKDEGIGMWRGLEEVEKEEDKIKIRITSIPDNAKLYLDDIALHHNTPSDEIELSDMLHLFTLGDHVLSAEKAGLSAMEDIEIKKGDNGLIHLILVSEPIPEAKTEEEIAEEELEEELEEEEVEEEKIEEEIIEEVTEPVKSAEIPTEYTSEQEWALKEAFEKILILTESTAVMSAKEREDLISSFNLYTTGQKVVLDLLWIDLTFYTQGRNQLSADEYIELKEKYRMI